MARAARPASSKPQPPLELTIDELAPGGDGVAVVELRGERRAVFVRGTVPGDRARVKVDLSSRPARGELLELLEGGATRATSPCAYARTCGGCDWMHVSLEGQLRAHEAHVRAALPPPWRELPIPSHAARDSLGRRSRARVHVRSSGGRAIVGMHEAGTHDPVEVDRCVVLHADLEAARMALAGLLEGAHGRGEAQIALGPIAPDDASSAARRAAVLSLTWSGPLAPQCYGRFEAAVAGGAFAGVSVRAGETSRPAVIGDPTPFMAGADGAPLRLAVGGFAQSSEEGNTRLAERVAALVRSVTATTSKAASDPLRVVELYAGAGNFTVLLARDGADVTAVEQSADACNAARANLASRGLSARLVEADASTFVLKPSTQLVLLDPPRTGARAVASRLVESRVRYVLYVSCDVATLGRDLAVLAAAYDARAVEIVEMFPYTSHVETLVMLERRRGSASSSSTPSTAS